MAACPVPWAFQGPTFHLAHDLWPWPCGQYWLGGSRGCRYQAAGAQATNERVGCFHSSCSLVRSWELQNWYFSKSWLLTWLCRQAVLTVGHVCVCRKGGGSLASSPSSATYSLWDFSGSLCPSGASVFLSGKQDSWIPAGAWARLGSELRGRGLLSRQVPVIFHHLLPTVPESAKIIPLLSVLYRGRSYEIFLWKKVFVVSKKQWSRLFLSKLANLLFYNSMIPKQKLDLAFLKDCLLFWRVRKWQYMWWYVSDTEDPPVLPPLGDI